jgi:hypothetical protein
MHRGSLNNVKVWKCDDVKILNPVSSLMCGK